MQLPIRRFQGVDAVRVVLHCSTQRLATFQSRRSASSTLVHSGLISARLAVRLAHCQIRAQLASRTPDKAAAAAAVYVAEESTL